jgi:hypothetical protein
MVKNLHSIALYARLFGKEIDQAKKSNSRPLHFHSTLPPLPTYCIISFYLVEYIGKVIVIRQQGNNASLIILRLIIKFSTVY